MPDEILLPQISVALVTRNRPESLERTLKSLRQQSVQPYEVIISDDSDAPCKEIVHQLAMDYDCCYIAGPRRGLYANRNHVALHCRGTHIRTMDDDHEFPEDHFSQCIYALENDPKSVWIIGEFLPDECHNAKPICPGQIHPRGFSVPPIDTQNCWAISDGASIYPRSIFVKGISYNDAFKFGASYLEFGSRLYKLGFRIRHLNTTYIIHHYEPNSRSFMDNEINLSSKFYATLCHSFLYQKTVSNMLLTSCEILKETVLRRNIGIRAFRKGLQEYRSQIKNIK